MEKMKKQNKKFPKIPEKTALNQKDVQTSAKALVLAGKVVSNSPDKTIVVEVEKIKKHPKYQRLYKRHQRYQAHDAENKHKVGDWVKIRESKPLSKNKKFTVIT